MIAEAPDGLASVRETTLFEFMSPRPSANEARFNLRPLVGEWAGEELTLNSPNVE